MALNGVITASETPSNVIAVRDTRASPSTAGGSSMDPDIAARAQRRWRVVLAFSALASSFAVVLAIGVGVVTAASGTDATTLFAVLTVALAVLVLLVGTIGAAGWWVLKRRDALGPSLLWGADRVTRRNVTTGLREQQRLDGIEHELALDEAGRVARFGLLLPGIMFTNVAIQILWLAVGWKNAPANPLLFGTRVFAVFFFTWGGTQGLIALNRARRYLALYADARQ
jgi:hypothetical protein